MKLRYPQLLRVTAVGALLASSGFALTRPGLSQGLGTPPTPPGNPTTADKVQLGKALFWDAQLSSNRAVACGSCHLLEAGGIDHRTGLFQDDASHPGPDGLFGTADDQLGSPGLPLTSAAGQVSSDASFGMRRRVTVRRAPTVINAAFAPELFWDGRTDSTFVDPITGGTVLTSNAALESLVAEPFVNEIEMGHVGRSWTDVVARIDEVTPLALSPSIPASLTSWIAGRPYRDLYAQAFGTAEVSAARTCMAVASYIRTLVADQTPYDRFQGGDGSALTPHQGHGLQVFRVARCDACHEEPTLTSHEFKYTGVRPRSEDLGRFLISGNSSERGAMKVPDIRNAGLRAPYFHVGSKATLNELLDFYSAGGDFEVGTNDFVGIPTQGANRTALIDFLANALTDPRVEQGLPPFDHPTLAEGTPWMPIAYGAGTAGGNPEAPKIHAFEASRIGTTDFTVAVDGAPAGAFAGLIISLVQDVAGNSFSGAHLHLVRSPGTRLFRTTPLQGTGPEGGWGSLTIPLPVSPALAGTHLYGQWVVVAPHAGGSLVSTRAIDITLFN